MNFLEFTFAGHGFKAAETGALYWPATSTLVVSDMHLGKSERIARRSGQMLPPYEVTDTLNRLENVIRLAKPACVICLGDSFDDLDAAHGLHPDHMLWLTRLMAGRDWIWIEGNHDPGPLEFGGRHLAEYRVHDLVFRHIALPGENREISGHYHPKAQISLGGRTLSRRCFLVDEQRLVLPSFGTYTGGLRSTSDTLSRLMSHQAQAILTGPNPVRIPMPRVRQTTR